MFVTHDRQKLINAILFFAKHTKHCHTLKLFKLLNFLDFEHYRQTGRTVTGLEYAAFPNGPVPPKLFEEIKRGGEKDLKAAIVITSYRDGLTNEVLRRDIKPKISYEKNLFTPREFKIMHRLALLFHDVRGEDMSELSHMKGLPWKIVYGNGAGKGKIIPAELALKSAPIDYDTPNIDDDERKYREEILKGIA